MDEICDAFTTNKRSELRLAFASCFYVLLLRLASFNKKMDVSDAAQQKEGQQKSQAQQGTETARSFTQSPQSVTDTHVVGKAGSSNDVVSVWREASEASDTTSHAAPSSGSVSSPVSGFGSTFGVIDLTHEPPDAPDETSTQAGSHRGTTSTKKSTGESTGESTEKSTEKSTEERAEESTESTAERKSTKKQTSPKTKQQGPAKRKCSKGGSYREFLASALRPPVKRAANGLDPLHKRLLAGKCVAAKLDKI